MDRKMNVSTASVLSATRKMLTKHGSAVSLELVAAEAGLTRQTLYNRFGSKQVLLKAAFDDIREKIRNRLDNAPWKSEPEVLLPVVAGIVVDNFLDLEMAKLLRAMIQAVEEMPEIGGDLKSEKSGQVLGRLAAYIELRTEAGEFQVANPEIQAMLFLGSISGFLFPRLLLGTATPDKKLNGELLDAAVKSFIRLWRTSN
ncbi:TetR/AcrR family transcriptional regulator [Brucella sp. HL-2]|jgi:TetR/AcrR family transcriptional repressor of mexJK operon|nr:TetR/AcrR family transcriptional regulator [Brucella sp. HL-2]MCV9909300.1 TetR/AcrR family transcriptional regulator [Brucella sp. HL-2]